MENGRIKLTVNGNEIFVNLEDNQASREFLEMLPLTLTFEDFNITEKLQHYQMNYQQKVYLLDIHQK